MLGGAFFPTMQDSGGLGQVNNNKRKILVGNKEIDLSLSRFRDRFL